MHNPFEDIISRLERIEALLVAQQPKTAQAVPVTIINTEELCLFLNVSQPTIIQWRKKGKIPFMKCGKNIRYSKEAVIKALEDGSR